MKLLPWSRDRDVLVCVNYNCTAYRNPVYNWLFDSNPPKPKVKPKFEITLNREKNKYKILLNGESLHPNRNR
jgi:hypothetical protein